MVRIPCGTWGMGGREGSHGSPVKRVLCDEDLVFPFEFREFGSKSGKFDQPFVRFRSTVAKEHLSRPDFGHEPFGQTDLFGNGKKIRAMNDLFRLLGHLFCPVGVAMTEVGHRNTAREVEKFPSLGIPKFGTLATNDFKSRTGIIADQVFLVLGRDHGQSIVHDLRADSFVGKNFE